MLESKEAIPAQIRAVLEGYLEILDFASDPELNSGWRSTDLHAAFEWAIALENIRRSVDLNHQLDLEVEVCH